MLVGAEGLVGDKVVEARGSGGVGGIGEGAVGYGDVAVLAPHGKRGVGDMPGPKQEREGRRCPGGRFGRWCVDCDV